MRLGGFEAAYRLSFFSGERHAAGERERLHAALGGNLRHRDMIDRLCAAVDEAHEVPAAGQRE